MSVRDSDSRIDKLVDDILWLNRGIIDVLPAFIDHGLLNQTKLCDLYKGCIDDVSVLERKKCV